MKSGSYLRSFWLHFLFLILMVSAVGFGLWQLVESEQAHQESEFRARAEDDLQLLQRLIHQAMLTRGETAVVQLVQTWGELKPMTLSIRIRYFDGSLIAEFDSRRQAEGQLRVGADLSLLGQQTAFLELVLEKNLRSLALEPGRQPASVLLALLAMALFAPVVLSLRNAWKALGLSTERRRLQSEMDHLENLDMELAAERSYLRAVVDSMPSVFAGVDPAGRVKQWNKAAEQSTRIKSEDALGQQFIDLMPHLSGQFRSLFDLIDEPGQQRTVRLTSVAGGAVSYSEMRVYPLASDAGSGAVVQVDDVTQQVRFEQMMVQYEKMLSLGGLAAGVAHEINSPLSGILQNCQNVSRRLSKDLVTNRQAAASAGIDLVSLQDYLHRRKIPELLSLVTDSADRAGQIINDMLAFSRRGTEGFEKLAVNDLLDSAVRLASSDYDMKKHLEFDRINIAQQVESNLPLLHCDPGRIKQVLLNLLKNSAQAMHANDMPDPRRIVLRAKAEPHVMVIQVEDNGPGMSAEIKQHVFEPFFSTNPSRAGLGLSVVYFIVTEQHQGDIEVLAGEQGGVLFEIRLPLTRLNMSASYGFTQMN